MSEQTEPTTTTETKVTKRRKAPKQEKKAATKPKVKAEKKAKTSKTTAPSAKDEDLKVFAFRMLRTESDALHTAAGPGRASKTMRALAAAFVAEDVDAFKALVKEAREARG